MIIIYLKKGSKKTADTEIAALLEKSYLSEMPNLFHKYEKDRIQRLIAMAPKRQSERIKQNAETTNQTDYDNVIQACRYDSDLDRLQSDLDGRIPQTDQERADDKIRKEQIAKQREERLKQRQMKRENNENFNGR